MNINGYLKNSWESDMSWWGIVDNEKMKLQVARRIIIRRDKRIKELEDTFKHYHVSGETDTCKECGLDLRDLIHISENK